jgi:Spy/CpxP family protein refolding chaperone
MVWAIVVLAVMNTSTILTIAYHRHQSGQATSITLPDQFQTEDASVKYSGRYFRDQLNLNRDQMNRFVEFNPVFRQQARSINISLERIRHQMLTEMAAKNSDDNKLNLLSDSIGYLHSGLKKLTFKYYLDIKNICDQQQQKKLEQLFGEMFTSDVRMGHNEKRGPNGRHYGRQFNY